MGHENEGIASGSSRVETFQLKRISGNQSASANPAHNGDTLTTQIRKVEKGASTGPVGTMGVLYRVLDQEGIVLLNRGFAQMSSERWS